MMAESRDAIARCNADPEIGAIVMTGAGRAFCAGADIGVVFNAQIEGERTARGAEPTPSAGEDYVTFLRRMPKPTIAAINGAAVGIGITQVLPFDVRIAGAGRAHRILLRPHGPGPQLGSSHFLPRLVGSGRALEWCLTGRMIAAEEAHAGGLVTEVVATEALLDRAVALGEELAARPLDSVRLIRSLLDRNAHEADIAEVQRREGDALREAYASPEHHEAVKAFLEKRTPDFGRARLAREAEP